MGSDVDNLLTTEFSLKADKLDSPKYCEVDATRTFAEGAVEAPSTSKKVDYRSMSVLDLAAISDETLQRLDATTKSSGAPIGVKELASEAGFAFKTPAGPERNARLRDIGLEGFDANASNAGVQKLKDELSTTTPNTDSRAAMMERGNAKPISELKEDSPRARQVHERRRYGRHVCHEVCSRTLRRFDL